MLSDLRFAFRQIAKSPGYAITIVLTLAFGIAVNTQIFALVSAVFLKPMPVRDPGRLATILQRTNAINLPQGASFLDFQDLRASTKSLVDHVAFMSVPAHVSVPGKSPERVWVEAVTPDAFQKLNVATILGRPLQPSDGELPPGAPVAVLTHHYWQNQLGGDPGVLGRTILINGKSFNVVGVAKAGFESFTYMLSMAAFVPSGASPQLRNNSDNLFKYRGMAMWNVLCYLRPGATMADANAEISVISERLAKDYPEEHRYTRFQAVPEQRARPIATLTDLSAIFLFLFSGLVVLVLIIACANVANLMAAQAVNREKEMVVRAALGATRWRLIRQLIIESIVLALMAGLAGYILSRWGGIILQQFSAAGDIPMRSLEGGDWRVGAFTVVISLVAGLSAGLFPALRSSRVNLNEGLKQNAGQQLGGGRHWMRNALVIGQVAMSCVVLITSALFFRGLRAAENLQLGFKPDRLIMLSVDLDLQGYDQARGLRYQKQVIEKVLALPGIEGADFTQHFPFNSGNDIVIRDVWPDNPTGAVPEGHSSVALSAVTPGFVKMFGIPLLRGRDLLPTDDEKAPHVAVINEAMAKAFWPGRDPIGQHFHRDWQGGPPIEVVGVVPTGKYIMLTEDPRPYYYAPFAQSYGMPASLVVRTSGDPRAISHSLLQTVQSVDPDLPIYHLNTFEEHMASSVFGVMPLRVGASMAGIQGTLALLLAVLGLYSVVSYGVSRRTREIGVRMALGATQSNVVRLVSREGLRLTFIGLAIGLLFALLISLVLSRVLFGVRPADPAAFVSVVAVLIATSALACALPALRATRVNPLEALRSE